jgi:hypothetical protein
MMGGVLQFFIAQTLFPNVITGILVFGGLYTLSIMPGSFSPRAIFAELSQNPKHPRVPECTQALILPESRVLIADQSVGSIMLPTRLRPRDVRYKVGRKAVLTILAALSIFYLRVAVVFNSSRSSLDLCTCWMLLFVAAVSIQPP